MEEVKMSQESLPVEVVALLRERARRLAETDEKTSATTHLTVNQEQIWLCFRLLDEHYALPLKSVREVIPLRSIVLIPGAPEHVAGLVRLRGKILALVDLRRFWQGAATGHADSDLAVIIEVRGVELGLVCTEVEDLLELDPQAINEIPQNIPSRLAACLDGLTRRETMLVNPGNLLKQPGFLVHTGAERK